jgi:hypothetical protein
MNVHSFLCYLCLSNVILVEMCLLAFFGRVLIDQKNKNNSKHGATSKKY